jgi:hypothetical protein
VNDFLQTAHRGRKFPPPLDGQAAGGPPTDRTRTSGGLPGRERS